MSRMSLMSRSEEPMKPELRGEDRLLPAHETGPEAPLDADNRRARIAQAVRRSMKRGRPDRPHGMAGRKTRPKVAAGQLLEEETPAESAELDLPPRAGGWEG